MLSQLKSTAIAVIGMLIAVSTLSAVGGDPWHRLLTSKVELDRVSALKPWVEDTLSIFYGRDTSDGVFCEEGRIYVESDSGWVYFKDHGYQYDSYMESFTFANVSPLEGDELIIVLNDISNGSRGGGTTSHVGVYSISGKVMLMSAEIGEEFSWYDGTGYRHCRRPYEFKDSTMYLLPTQCKYGEGVVPDEPYDQDTIAIPMWLD